MLRISAQQDQIVTVQHNDYTGLEKLTSGQESPIKSLKGVSILSRLPPPNATMSQILMSQILGDPTIHDRTHF